MSYMKGVRSGAEGNRSLLKQYGGNSGSGPAARQHYASGGAVKGGNPSLNEGLSAAADGKPAKPSLARPGRKMPGKGGAGKKGGKTNVNVIIAQAPDKGAMPPALGAGPGPGGPPPGPPMPPPGAGGPPMPMRASGGRINNLGAYAHGGKVKDRKGFATDGWVGEGDSVEVTDAAKRKALRDKQWKASKEAGTMGAMTVGTGLARMSARAAPAPIRGILNLATGVGALGTAANAGAAKKHKEEADALEDRKSGGKVVCRDGGGPVGLRDNGKLVGSGGGLGRLAKARKYGK